MSELREAAQAVVDHDDAKHRLADCTTNIHHIALRAALSAVPESAASEEAPTYTCCPHDHEDDGYGNCILCRVYVPHTDDDTNLVPYPCAAALIRDGSVPSPEPLDVLRELRDAAQAEVAAILFGLVDDETFDRVMAALSAVLAAPQPVQEDAP